MDDALHELTNGWMAKASADWKTAERLEPKANEQDYDAVLLGSAAFHLRQAAEKSLKAFLTAKSVRFSADEYVEVKRAAEEVLRLVGDRLGVSIRP